MGRMDRNERLYEFRKDIDKTINHQREIYLKNGNVLKLRNELLVNGIHYTVAHPIYLVNQFKYIMVQIYANNKCLLIGGKFSSKNEKKIQVLKALGYKSMFISYSEIYFDVNRVINRIKL